MDEPVGSPAPPAPSIRQALGVIAVTAVAQARDLVVARLDQWAEEIRHQNGNAEASEATAMTMSEDDTAPSLPASLLTMPVLVGAVAGATVAWLLARRPSQS